MRYDANVVIVHVLWENYFSVSRPDRFDVFGAVWHISLAVVFVVIISSVVNIHFDIAVVGGLVRPDLSA